MVNDIVNGTVELVGACPIQRHALKYIHFAVLAVCVGWFIHEGLGLAYLRGEDRERNDFTAYYWLRKAEQNAEQILEESRRAVQELRQSMTEESLRKAERSVAENEPRPKGPAKGQADPKCIQLPVNKRFAI